MLRELVRLEIHLRFKHHKLCLLAPRVETEIMVFAEVFLERFVVSIVLGLPSSVPPVADVAFLMGFSTVREKLIVAVESLAAEAALWVAFKAALVDRARVVVAELLVLTEFWAGKEFVLMCEDLLISCAQVAHDLMMHIADMLVQIWPSKASCLAILLWTIVSKEQDRIVKNVRLLILDAEDLVNLFEIGVDEVFISLDVVVREYDILSLILCKSVLPYSARIKRHIPDSERSHVSCIMPSSVMHRCGMSGGYMA